MWCREEREAGKCFAVLTDPFESERRTSIPHPDVQWHALSIRARCLTGMVRQISGLSSSSVSTRCGSRELPAHSRKDDRSRIPSYGVGFALRLWRISLSSRGFSRRIDWILGAVSPDPLHILQRWPSPSVLWPRHRGQAINILIHSTMRITAQFCIMASRTLILRSLSLTGSNVAAPGPGR